MRLGLVVLSFFKNALVAANQLFPLLSLSSHLPQAYYVYRSPQMTLGPKIRALFTLHRDDKVPIYSRCRRHH